MHRQGRGWNNSHRRRGGSRRYQYIFAGVSIILVYVVYKSFQEDETPVRFDSSRIGRNHLVQGEWRGGTVNINKPPGTTLHDNQTELNKRQKGATLDVRHNDTNKDIESDKYRATLSWNSNKNTSDDGEGNSIKLNSNQTYINSSNRAVNATLTSKSVGSPSLDRTETREGHGVNRTNIQMDNTLPNTGGERTSGELLKKRDKSDEYVAGIDWASATDRAKLEDVASHALKLANVAQYILAKHNVSLSTQRNLYIGNKTQLVEDFFANAQTISKAAKDVLVRIKYHEAKDMSRKMNDTKLVEGFAADAKTFAKLANEMNTNTNFNLSDTQRSENEVNKTKSLKDFAVEVQIFANYANDLFIDRSVGLSDAHMQIRNLTRQGVIDKFNNITNIGLNVLDMHTLTNLSTGGVLEKIKINTGTLIS